MAASDIAEAAAAWLIRLEAQTSPEIWDRFQEWLDADPRHRAAFIRLRTAWTHCDRLKLLRPADGRIDRDLFVALERGEPGQGVPEFSECADTTPGGRPPLFSERRRWLFAAAAGAIAGLGLLGWLGEPRSGSTYYETAVGGSQRVRLADGSSVLLNTDSRLRVELSATRRDIELIRGEALFTVAHDKLRPFYVSAAGTLVRAVGTEFSVRIHDDRTVEVLVTEGRVAVGIPDHHLTFGPVLAASTAGVAALESAVVGNDTVAVKRLSATCVARKLAWTSGRIAFEGEPLTEAVREFNRYNRRRLVIADPAIRQVQVGGIFEATDPKSFVVALEKSFGVSRMGGAVRGDDDVIRLVSRDLGTPPRPSNSTSRRG
jgi:transmembrane sensor